MAWLVPYVINGAAHSAALFRRQAQRPASDKAGVALPGDLKVTQLPAAAGGFRIAQGSLSLPSGFAGRSRESYGVENADAAIDITDVAGTGSSARSDAVVVEVLDPNYAAIDPEDAAAENYTRVTVVQGVSSSATSVSQLSGFENRTAYMLARIDWPASTTAITNAMIKDCRTLANPREKTVQRAFGLTAADDGEEQLDNRTAYPAGETWPDAAVAEANFRIEIPSWATQAVILMLINGVKIPATTGNAYGRHWVQIGANTDPDVVRTEPTRWDVLSAGGAYRTVFSTADTVNIPAGMRGTTKRFYPRGNVELGATLSCPIADWATSVYMMVTFREVKE